MREYPSSFRGVGLVAVCMAGLLVGSACGESAVSTGPQPLACPNASEFWYVSVPDGGGRVNLDYSVDTTSISTAFDIAATVYTVAADGGLGVEVQRSDDQFECTFPPPDFRCPSGRLDVVDDIIIEVRSLNSCASDLGRYELSVTGAEAIELF